MNSFPHLAKRDFICNAIYSRIILRKNNVRFTLIPWQGTSKNLPLEESHKNEHT